MVYINRHLSYLDPSTSEQKFVPEQGLLELPLPLVILGEPGMGKSGLLRSIAAKHQSFEMTTALALKRRRQTVLPGRTLLIDGLDELPGAQEQDPVQDVLQALADLGAPPFVLSCRASEWRNVARQSIREDYGREPVELKLSAFSRDEATAFLSERHGSIGARELINRMDEQGIAEFYGNPLTLQLVDRLAASPGGLPADRADLFLRASDELRKEQNPDRPRSVLTSLSRDDALDAAGAASAALVLTGSEAINLGAHGALVGADLQIADVASLPGASAIRVAVSSMLFQRRDGGDRVAPFHRAIAEFLAARWLARQAEEHSARRLLSLMTFEGGVPASLRGIHAWLAYFSIALRPAVIAADPFGVLRYGDTAHLSGSEGRQFLHALELLSEIDPYFAMEDRRRFNAPALTQISMASELRRVLMTPSSAFQLKSILLRALPGSAAAPELAPDLIAIFMTPESEVVGADRKPRFTFHERAEALDILADFLPKPTWADRVSELINRPTEDDRRLAVDTVCTVGSTWFPPDLISRTVLSYVGLLPGQESMSTVQVSGGLYLLARAIAGEQTAAVLDGLVVLGPKTKMIDWRASYEFAGFVDHLISRSLDWGRADPIRLLGWLRLVRDRQGGESDARNRITQFLGAEHSVRRAIQHQLIFVNGRAEGKIDWLWRASQIHPSLGYTIDDLIEHLHPSNFQNPPGPYDDEVWQRLVAQGLTSKGLPPELVVMASRTAESRSDRLAFLVQINQKRVPKWEREEKIRKWRRRAKQRRRFEKRRKEYLGLTDRIAEGSWQGLSVPADVYLNRAYDLDQQASPLKRLQSWVGEELAAQMVAGFEAGLHRDDLPSLHDVVEGHMQSRRYRYTAILQSGAWERALIGRSLEDLREEVVLLVAMGEIFETSPESIGGELLETCLRQWFTDRAAAWERLWRTAIEPQLATRREHVTGLYKFLRSTEHRQTIARLTAEWLQRYPDLPSSIEVELMSYLSSLGDWEALLSLFQARIQQQSLDSERRDRWLAVAYFMRFEEWRERLESTAREGLGLFHAIRHLGWPEGGAGRGRLLDPARLAWLVRTFRASVPAVERGDAEQPISWEAADFIRSMIRRLAADTSDAAVLELSALREEAGDGYEPFLRNACAQQIKARRDAGFEPPALADLETVLQGGAPTGVADLQAVVLDALETVQRRMNRDDVDQVSMFYDVDVPKGEEACRDRLVILLRDLVGYGVDTIPERMMPGGKRADIEFALKDLRLPLEAKGQWHPELWTAASEQLDGYYSVEWRAQGYGIYLVFWFGDRIPEAKRLRSPGRNERRPTTAAELRVALIKRLPEHRRGQIAVFVLDVSRAEGMDLVPTKPDEEAVNQATPGNDQTP